MTAMYIDFLDSSFAARLCEPEYVNKSVSTYGREVCMRVSVSADGHVHMLFIANQRNEMRLRVSENKVCSTFSLLLLLLGSFMFFFFHF